MPDPERPVAPKWLSRAARSVFEALADDLASAGVSIRRIDAHAIAMAAHCLAEVQALAKEERKAYRQERKQEIPRMGAKFRKQAEAARRTMLRCERDAQVWLTAIGATPMQRIKLGIRPVKKLGLVATMIAAKERAAAARRPA